VSGVAAGRAAAAAGVRLCSYARDKLDSCTDNLAVMRGELHLPSSPMTAQRTFDTLRAPLPKIAPSLCSACGADYAALRCSRCMTARYCNAVCQRADWAAHKGGCAAAAAAKK
jgi:hypothetical protein